MRLTMRVCAATGILLASVALQACKHPLAIEGEGDIVDVNSSGHGCTLEQFRAQDAACTANEVSGDYFVNYKAQPRPGWRFVRWDGPCSPQSDFQHCRVNITGAGVTWWDDTYPDAKIPPSTAVFQPISGKTGYLVDTAVAGLAYKTATKQGVTGLDGSFQYEEGETVRFMLGNTVVGEVTGRQQVTPFDLAGSAEITGTLDITRALETQHNPFHTVINIAVLLQSMDQDGNPGNGITIRQSLAELFRGVSLDVSQPWQSFQNESALRHVLAQANTRRLFSKAHGSIKPAFALQHLYGALGIDARTSAVTLQQRSEGGALVPVETSQYDANGNLTQREQDWEGDGSVNFIESWSYDGYGNTVRHERQGPFEENTESLQYDANGRQTRYEEDHYGDGTAVDIQTWQYDASGKLTRLEHFYNNNGKVSLQGSASYQYDANGNLIREQIKNQGSPDRIIHYQYDAYGNITRQVTDEDGSGRQNLIATWQYQYDANGRPTRGELDADNDGTPNRIDSYQYDASGKLVEQGLDFNVDGNTDMFWTWRYDANGNLIMFMEERGPSRDLHSRESWQYDANDKLMLHERDENGDGMPELSERWQYDANGSPTRHEQDDNGDGLPDQIDSWQYRYEYGANSRLTRRERYDNGDTLDQIVSYAYDANGKLAGEERWTREAGRSLRHWEYGPGGNLLRELGDEGADGTINELESYQYDARGNLSRHEIDWNGDGAADLIESYQYDARGNLTRRDKDENGDGTPESTDVWAYQYNGRGRLTQKAYDEHNDGTPDLIESWAYDARGNTARYQWRCGADNLEDVADLFACFFNSGSDYLIHYGDYGFPDFDLEKLVMYEYDADNRLRREEVTTDSDSDGKVDDIKRYQYDPNGNRTRYEGDHDGDGAVDRIETWQYDARGNVTRFEIDYDDGTPVEFESWTYQYDTNGNLTQQERYSYGGDLLETVSYEYDADGNLTRQSVASDQNGDGALEITETRDYEATGWGHIFAAEP
jgi:RHS Repeat